MIHKVSVTPAKVLFATIVFALGSITAIFGYMGYSLHGYLDSVGTLPPSVSLALGHGFKDHLTDVRSLWGDPTGQERYLWFPPFFSLTISAFLFPSLATAISQQAIFVGGIIGAIALLLVALVFYKIATLYGKKLDIYGAILMSALLAIIARSSWVLMARPEPLETLILGLSGLCLLCIHNQKKLIITLAVLLGVIAATHPFGMLLLICIAGLYFSLFYEWRQSSIYMTSLCLLGFIAFVAVMQWSPFSIAETIAGIARHNAHETQRINSFSFSLLLGFAKSPYAILYAITLIFGALFSKDFYRHLRDRIKSPWLFAGFSLLIVAISWYYIVMGFKTYYALMVAFFIFSLLVYHLLHIAKTNSIKYLALIFLVLFAALSLKPVLVFPAYLKNGVSIAYAREKVAPTLAHFPKADIFITGDLWSLSEDHERMHVSGDFTPEYESKRPFILLLDQNRIFEQWSPGPTPPAQAQGCPLKEDYFVKTLPIFFGIKMSDAMPGYGFAIYVCQ